MLVVVECEKNTKQRYEKSKITGDLEYKYDIDTPWVANYGYVDGTLQADGDEMDAYVFGKRLLRGQTYMVEPVCVIVVFDKGKRDDKVVATLKGENELFIKSKVKSIVKKISKKKDNLVLGCVYDRNSVDYLISKARAYRRLFGGN